MPALLLGVIVVLSGCGSLDEEVAVDWADHTRQSLLEAGEDLDIVECAVDLNRRELLRGPLDQLAIDESVRHCRTALVLVNGGSPDEIPDTELALTDVAWTLGDDAALDDLWTRCEAGSGQACDDLFELSPIGSDYEDFGVSCGRRPNVLHCAELDQPTEADQAESSE